MKTETISKLAANPPPTNYASETTAKIFALETRLGLPHSRMTFNTQKLSARLTELEGLARTTPVSNLPQVATTPQNLTPAKKLGAAALEALHGLVFDRASTSNVVTNAANWQHGAARMDAANAAVTEARKFGSSSPALREAELARVKLTETLRLEREGTEQDKCDRLLRSFAEHGLTIPGCTMPNVVPTGYMSNRDRADYQAAINQFCAGLAGETSALFSNSPIGNKVRQFVLANHPERCSASGVVKF